MKKLGGYLLNAGVIALLSGCLGEGLKHKEGYSLSLSSTSGPVGTLLTVTGIDFSTLIEARVAGVEAIPVSTNSSTVKLLVMPGATKGLVQVTTTNGDFLSSEAFTVTATGVPANQQGSKLIPVGHTGNANFAYSTAISADGNIALIGGSDDNSDVGGTWVYIRSGASWTLQTKLLASDAVGAAGQGISVALSADGVTALVGGASDNGGVGAAWVFTRSGTNWSKQAKLIGTGALGNANQGSAVALSADGDTAVVSGSADNSNVGAAWVFTRSGTSWSQQTKLTPIGAPATPQVATVALSADGRTALVRGGNGTVDVISVFTRSGTSWSEEAELTGTGALGAPFAVESLALSADGNTALLGNDEDNTSVGAAWVFTRSGTTWSQQTKLVGTDAVGTANQGRSVALSADGNTALVGGPNDNSQEGATWVFTRSGSSWSQSNKLVGTGSSGGHPIQGVSASLSADGVTALIGAPVDTGVFRGGGGGVGACWVFTP